MKKTRLFVLLALLALAVSLCSVASAEFKTVYTNHSESYVDAVGWYFNNNVMLMLNDDNTYDLIYTQTIFGTTDPGDKGSKTVIYSGVCTVAESADGEPSHLDVTLDTCDRVYMEQHGKAFGRQVINYTTVLDSANWTDAMTDAAFPAGTADPAADFVANHSIAGMTMTVEDLQIDIDDVTLASYIIEMPDITKLDIAE